MPSGLRGGLFAPAEDIGAQRVRGRHRVFPVRRLSQSRWQAEVFMRCLGVDCVAGGR